MKHIKDLSKTQLWKLRKQITLNSYFISDYENTYGIDANEVCDFFSSYVEYLWELGCETKKDYSLFEVIEKFDNAKNLYDFKSYLM